MYSSSSSDCMYVCVNMVSSVAKIKCIMSICTHYVGLLWWTFDDNQSVTVSTALLSHGITNT